MSNAPVMRKPSGGKPTSTPKYATIDAAVGAAGLLHDLTVPEELDARVDEVLGLLLKAGPGAQAECKLLLRAAANRAIDAPLIAETAKRIATVRASAEGKGGVAAFLGKRSAGWVPRDEQTG